MSGDLPADVAKFRSAFNELQTRYATLQHMEKMRAPEPLSFLEVAHAIADVRVDVSRYPFEYPAEFADLREAIDARNKFGMHTTGLANVVLNASHKAIEKHNITVSLAYESAKEARDAFRKKFYADKSALLADPLAEVVLVPSIQTALSRDHFEIDVYKFVYTAQKRDMAEARVSAPKRLRTKK